MSDRPEPSEADVDRLAAAWYGPHWNPATEGPGGIVTRVQRESARQAIARGVSLPPEPEPPQERYYVHEKGEEPDASYLVRDRTAHFRTLASCEFEDEAERIARLLNADEADDGEARDHWRIEAEGQRERAATAEARAELAEALAEGRRKQLVAMADYDSLAARVKELEGELAEVKQNYDQAWAYAREQEAKVERVRAREREMMVDLDAATAKVRLLEEEVAIADERKALGPKPGFAPPGEKQRMMQGVWPKEVGNDTVDLTALPAEWDEDDAQPATDPAKNLRVIVDRQRVQGYCPACRRTALVLGDGGHVTCSHLACPSPTLADEVLSDRREVTRLGDAQPAEPLFTGEAVNVNGGRVLFIPDDFSIIAGTPLDVYPAGARPAPRAITAEDVEQVALTYLPLILDRLLPGVWHRMADALNARRAGDKPEGE